MTFNPVQTIREKRDGKKLSPAVIDAFLRGAVNGQIPEYQVTAFLMATFFQGMDLEETIALTDSMVRSGKQIRFDDQAAKIDKHSTGGVGDKISIILAPLVAALGVDVPMVAGRGLSHTGGTLDKLESIPGFRVSISVDEFTRQISHLGVAIMGQTDEFVPADKLFYSLRDVTATVECIPLITGSILSKKVAEGITGLVLDIKTGNGAFMKTQKEAERLAKCIVSVGSKMGLKIRALITDMNQPLGRAVGNSLEILECIEVLKGGGPNDIRELTVELAAHMCCLAGKCSSLSASRSLARKALQDGSAARKFTEMCQAQGSTIDPMQDFHKIPVSNHAVELLASRSGVLTRVDTEAVGHFVVDLGGGRKKVSDGVHPGVGLLIHAKIGDKVKKGDRLVEIFYDPSKVKKTDDLISRLANAFVIGGGQVSPPKLIKKVLL